MESLQRTAHPHASTPASDHWDQPQWISAVITFKSTQPFTGRIQFIWDTFWQIFSENRKGKLFPKGQAVQTQAQLKGGRAGAVPARAVSHSTQIRQVGQIWAWQVRIQTTTQVCHDKAGPRSWWELKWGSGLVWATRVRQPSDHQASPQWPGNSTVLRQVGNQAGKPACGSGSVRSRVTRGTAVAELEADIPTLYHRLGLKAPSWT